LIGQGGFTQVTLHVSDLDVWALPAGETWSTIVEGLTIQATNVAISIYANPKAVIRKNRLIGELGVVSASPLILEDNWIEPDPGWWPETHPLELHGAHWPDSQSGVLSIARNVIVTGEFGFNLNLRQYVTSGAVHHNTFVYPGWPGWPAFVELDIRNPAVVASSNIFWGFEIHCHRDNQMQLNTSCFHPWLPASGSFCQALPPASIAQNPQFCEIFEGWLGGDYRLSPGSPCIGTGEGGTNMGALGVGCELLGVEDLVAGVVLTELAVFPNPTGGVVGFGFGLALRGAVLFEVFDLGGRMVARPFEGSLDPGRHTLFWDLGATAAGKRVPPGVYFLRIRSGRDEIGRRLVVR
jgi:hypothetical protein